MSQSQRIIDAALGEIIEYTVNWLAPLYGIIEREYPLPWAILQNKETSYYYPHINTITMTENHLRSNRTFGHEVGHYLHGIISPARFERDDLENRNLAELVAEYGSLIFTSYHHPFIEEKKRAIFQELENNPLPKKILTAEEEVFFKKKSYEIHEGGISAAEFLFNVYGTQCLLDFANTNVEAAQEMLRTLGWQRSLFVAFEDRDKEYEYSFVEEDAAGKKQQVIVIVGGCISGIYHPETREL